MKQHACGCWTSPDPVWYVTRSVRKCPFHIQWLKDHPSGGEDYYKTLGVYDDEGNIRTDKYVYELSEAIGALPNAPLGGGLAVEIGTGISPYAFHLKQLGYYYVGFEPDPWAAQQMRDKYRVHMENRKFEELEAEAVGQAHLVLSAHAIEHIPDSPGALREMYRLLAPGRPLYLVVPDDTDLTNPDHLWFYNSDSLRYVLNRLGFEDIKIEVRQIIPKEKFIYCSARKPHGH